MTMTRTPGALLLGDHPRGHGRRRRHEPAHLARRLHGPRLRPRQGPIMITCGIITSFSSSSSSSSIIVGCAPGSAPACAGITSTPRSAATPSPIIIDI